MRNRPRVQRSLLKRAMRRQLIRSTEAQRELITITLGDSAIFETFYEQAMQDAALAATTSGDFNVALSRDGSPVVDNLLKLLTWFVENGPQLLKLVETILGLFGGPLAAAVVCDSESPH